MFAAEEGGRRDGLYTPLCTTHLVTDAGHPRFLVDISATSTVMISPYNVAPPKKLFEEGIGQAIIDVAERDVSVMSIMKIDPTTQRRTMMI